MTKKSKIIIISSDEFEASRKKFEEEMEKNPQGKQLLKMEREKMKQFGEKIKQKKIEKDTEEAE